jgi:hypothetical protein
MDSLTLLTLIVNVITSVLIASLVFSLCVCIQRLWFHPLSKYPGPFWAKLIDFHAAFHSWRGDLHIDMWRSHEKYGTQNFISHGLGRILMADIDVSGKYVRYGPNRLIFNTTQALEGK